MMNILKRILTAVILLPIFIALVLYLTPYYFGVLTTGFVLIAAWE